MNSFYRVQSEYLTELTSLILQKNGVIAQEADVTAKSLVDADLRGVSSHGVIRMSNYLSRLKKGVTTAKPKIEIVKETESTAVFDGDYGLGQVVSQRAVEILSEKATKANLAAVTVRRSNHFGAAAYWAMQLLDKDMIGIALSNVEPLMPPPGGAGARVGNNPLAIAVPAGKSTPIVIDMATSVVALGKILAAKSKGQTIPEGWGVDKTGLPTTNPDDVVNGGFLYPVGGPKGYGLAVAVDVLTSLLSKGAIGKEIGSMYNDLEHHNDLSHFFMAIRIDAFLEPQVFKDSVDRYIEFIKNTPLAVNTEQIYLPGEIEHLTKMKNLQEGIMLPASVADELELFASEAGIEAGYLQELKKHQS